MSERAELYTRAMVVKNESFGRYAPAAAPWPSPPADHPHNPFDVDQMIADGLVSDQAQLWGYYRWDNIGNRDGFVDDFQWDFSAGVKGDLNERISFDAYAQTGRYESDDLGQYFLWFPGLEFVLENGIDPFSQEGIAAMRTETWRDSFTEQSRAYGHLQIDAWDFFGAGDSIALVGVEYVTFDYENLYDPRSEAGEVGGSAGWSNGGDRDVGTVFFEYLLPVTGGTEISLAGRYDHYSDFGGTFTPSVGIVSNLTDTLTVRARWGEGFVAPDMDELYGPSLSGRSVIYDPVLDADYPADTYSFANEELEPETSTSISLGFNWEFLDGHSIESIADAPRSIRDTTAANLVDLAFAEVFAWGLVQTDPNFANFRYASHDRSLHLLDFGATREYPVERHAALLCLLQAGLEEDRDALLAAAVEAGYLAPGAPPASCGPRVPTSCAAIWAIRTRPPA